MLAVSTPSSQAHLPVAPGTYGDYAERVYGTRTPPRASDVVVGTPSVSVSAVA